MAKFAKEATVSSESSMSYSLFHVQKTVFHDLFAAVEVLQFEIEFRTVDQRLSRANANELRADDSYAVAVCQGADHLVGVIKRRAFIVDHVHGDLGNIPIFQHDSEGLAVLEAA